MKCPICGTNLNNNEKRCPVCGTTIQTNTSTTYTDKTKSKALAGILMLFGVGDLYLLDFRKFVNKLIVSFFTLGIGGFIWQMIDAYKVFSGKINCDINGIPLR